MVPSLDDQLANFFTNTKTHFFKRGEVVLSAQAITSSAFYLKRGFIKDSSVSSEGEDFILFIFQPADIFSYNLIYNNIPNEHSFTAMTDCNIYERDKEEFLNFLKLNPSIQLHITKKIVTRLRGLTQRIESMAFDNALKRTSTMLYILAERFGKQKGKNIHIPIPLTHQDIASLIGLTRETTSIEIRNLMKMGIVLRSSQFYIITNMQRLKSMSSLS